MSPAVRSLSHVELARDCELAIVSIVRGKVNALDQTLVDELDQVLEDLAQDETVRGLVLTGRDSFFSFGFDIPGLFELAREEFTAFVERFTGLYTRLFEFPRPVVAAINGHAVASGCMLALACDRRLMARGKGKISLNEIGFGSSVFAGSVEMLRACVGTRTAETILYRGELYDTETAMSLGLVDRIVHPEELRGTAAAEARWLAGRDAAAFRSMKSLLRGPIATRMRELEPASIQEFVEIWYSPATRERLRQIEIRG